MVKMIFISDVTLRLDHANARSLNFRILGDGVPGAAITQLVCPVTTCC